MSDGFLTYCRGQTYKIREVEIIRLLEPSQVSKNKNVMVLPRNALLYLATPDSDFTAAIRTQFLGEEAEFRQPYANLDEDAA